MKVGIYLPRHDIGKYNTDRSILNHFLNFNDPNIQFQQISHPVYDFTFNLNKLINKLKIKTDKLVIHKTPNRSNVDVIYHYGHPINAQSFFHNTHKIPKLVTTGLRTDRYRNNSNYLSSIDEKSEAKLIAKTLKDASLMHFHTDDGRERFLNHCPEFTEKCITIPFFLPYLSSLKQITKSSSTINILFVGYDGKRKGVDNLVTALDNIGSRKLNSYNVKTIIVSKDKPLPKEKWNLEWHSYLPKEIVMNLMHEASIFALVPNRESYGLVFIEAMMAKVAIIADDDTPRKEILGPHALTIKPGDTSSLTEALLFLIENEKNRSAIGSLLYSRACERFAIESVAPQYISAFERIK